MRTKSLTNKPFRRTRALARAIGRGIARFTRMTVLASGLFLLSATSTLPLSQRALANQEQPGVTREQGIEAIKKADLEIEVYGSRGKKEEALKLLEAAKKAFEQENYEKAQQLANRAFDLIPKLGKYPDFSGAGNLGNPAFWSQTGNWLYLLVGQDAANSDEEREVVGLTGNFGLFDDAFFIHPSLTGKFGDPNFLGDAVITNLTATITMFDLLSLGAGVTTTVDGIGTQDGETVSTTGNVGLLYAHDLGDALLRIGTMHDFKPGGATTLSIETRFYLWQLEITTSARALADFSTLAYRGQRVGLELRYDAALMALSVGGPDELTWDKVQAYLGVKLGDVVVEVKADFTTNDWIIGINKLL